MTRKSDEEIDKGIERIKRRMQRGTEKAIKSQLCKKCGGVIVRSFVTAQMAMTYGKSCNCKSPSIKIKKKKKRKSR